METGIENSVVQRKAVEWNLARMSSRTCPPKKCRRGILRWLSAYHAAWRRRVHAQPAHQCDLMTQVVIHMHRKVPLLPFFAAQVRDDIGKFCVCCHRPP